MARPQPREFLAHPELNGHVALAMPLAPMNNGQPLPMPAVKPKRRKWKAPASRWKVPALRIASFDRGLHVLKYGESSSFLFGVSPPRPRRLELFVAVSDEGPAPFSEARYHGTYTRGSIKVHFDPKDNRRVATYYARWGGANGEASALSQPQWLAVVV